MSSVPATASAQGPPAGTNDALSLKPAAAVSQQFQAKEFRVIVLGAGMSGLACARELIQRGYQVLVVEARDRVGGRLKGGVKTNDREGGNEGMKTLPGTVVNSEDPLPKPIYTRTRKDTTTPVDLGGALIHGIEGNPIYSITQQMGVPTRPVSECLLYEGSGWPVDTRKDERMSNLFNECLEETFDRIASAENKDSASNPTLHPADFSSDDTAENRPPSHEQNNGDSQKKMPAITKVNTNTGDKESAGSVPTVPCDSPSSSFGDVFEQVCMEKGAPLNSPLFQWHQANLEVSCGASFPDLGYKWNDDEPYGYDGQHVAVKTSWKPVMEGLTEGVDILYQSPVKTVTMIVPDPPPEPPPAETIVDQGEGQPLLSTPSQPENQVASDVALPVAPASAPGAANTDRNTKKRVRTPSTAPLPSRRSRRLRGDDAGARRSSRATKGQKVDRFVVSEFGADSYDVSSPAVLSPNHRGSTQRKRQLPDIDENQTRVQVTLENGEVLEANAVVCTLPLGILKLDPGTEKEPDAPSSSGGIRFYPPLSERKQNAIERLGCGLLNKCVLSFSHVFWNNSDFLGLAHPANSYLILNASTFVNKPILIFMYGGTFAKEIESWTDNEIVADCLEVLKIICGRDIPSPEDYAVTRWGQEKYSRMAFSYVPPGVDGAQELKAMSEAVYDPLIPRRPVIMFAGEHTTQFHPSTIHGAFLSGIREAYRLDLFVEPEANDHLEFEEEHLYQHTFAVRRLFQELKPSVARAPRRTAAAAAPSRSSIPLRESQEPSASIQPQSNANRRQHRRRGAATVMSLRERPESALPETENDNVSQPRRRPQQSQRQSQNTGQNGTSHSPARRSRRSVYSINQQQNSLEKNGSTQKMGRATSSASVSAQEAVIQKKHILSLEGRTIMRALESYGFDYSYIQSTVLPVYGNTMAQKTVAQIGARCQQLARSIVSSAPAAKKILDLWVAKNIYKPPPVPKKPKAKSRAAPTASRRPVRNVDSEASVEATRRSSRGHRQRQILNL